MPNVAAVARRGQRLAALALPPLSQVKGVFGSAWFCDPAIQTVSPRITFAQDLQVGQGAMRMKVGSNDMAIANATATSPTPADDDRGNISADGLRHRLVAQCPVEALRRLERAIS